MVEEMIETPDAIAVHIHQLVRRGRREAASRWISGSGRSGPCAKTDELSRVNDIMEKTEALEATGLSECPARAQQVTEL